MRSIKRYFGWIIIVLLISAAVLAFSFADSSIVKRTNDITTILLALLTAAYVIFTYQILRSTRPQPHVFVSLPTSEIEIFLSIKNIGARPAYDVHITIDPSLDTLAPTDAFKGASGPMLYQPFMPPESEVRNFVTSTLEVLSVKNKQTKFKIHIRYKDSERRSYSDKYEIDFASYVFEKKFLDYDRTHYLHEISDTLKKMTELLEKK
jgi:hypothetical protein